MRFAISKFLEKPNYDSESDFSSVKSNEYNMKKKLELKGYKGGKFIDDSGNNKTPVDETIETSKTVFLADI